WYTITITLLLLFNYYISYQVLLFTALWTLVRLWENRSRKPLRTILSVAAHTVAAAGVGAVVLLPAFLELDNSPKDMLLIGAKSTGKMPSLTDVFSKAYVLAYDALQPRFGLPQIYCGILFGALALLFFLDHRRSLRERVSSIIPLLVLLSSFCLDPLNVFWHAMMEPSGHPYRQAPLFVFVCILAGCRYLAGIGTCEETEGSGQRVLLYRIARYALGLLAAGGMLFFVGRGNYEYNNGAMLTENALRVMICFVGLFALESLSGTAGQRAEDGKPVRKGIAAILTAALIGMLSAELLGNAAFTYDFLSLQGETRNGFLSEIDTVQPVVDAVKAEDGSFYRMENLTPRQQNDAMMYGYRGVTHYSSAGMVYVRYLLHKLGFNDDTLMTHYGHDNTVTMDMLLGIRYVLTRDGRLVHDAYKRIEAVPETGVMVYRNPYALPVAVAVRDYDLDGITGIDNPYTIPMDPFALQEDMLSRLTGSETHVFVPASAEESGETDGKELDVWISPQIPGEVYMYLDGLMNTVQGLAVFVDEELLTGYGNASSYKILNLGYHEAGDTFHVRVEGDSDAPNFGRPIFVTEDMQAVEEVFSLFDGRGLEVRQHGSAGIDLQAPDDHAGIVTSIPYEKGWNVPGIRIYGALLYIPPEIVERYADGGVLAMRFVPRGMKAGAVISLLFVILLGVWLLRARGKSRA
ncbi:MAG: YfhO family protein, partial [Lachnospiraceae bacterium]|nr:YfhO family protein [Lachnospiraceae bacterium]